MLKMFETADVGKVLDVNRWVAQDGHFMDPATGEVLGQDDIYQWLLADERMMIGRDYLGEIASRTTITALYGRHGDGGDLPGNTESIIGEHHALGVEVYGWSRDDHLGRMNRVPDFLLDKRVKIKQERWEGRQFIAAHDADVPTFSFDVESNGPPLDKFIMYYLRFYDEARRQGLATDTQQKLYLAINDLRECAWPLKLGFELSKLQRRLPSGDLKVMMSMGSAHRYVSKRLSNYGVTVEDWVVDPNPRSRASRALLRCMMTRRVTDQDLAEGAGG